MKAGLGLLDDSLLLSQAAMRVTSSAPTVDGDILCVRQAEIKALEARLEPGELTKLRLLGDPQGTPDEVFLAAAKAMESILATGQSIKSIELAGNGWTIIENLLLERNLAVLNDGRLFVLPEMFWQFAAFWMQGKSASCFPQLQIMSGARRHPRRPQKPKGEVYARHIPWLDQTITFRALDLDGDLPRFNRWMNDPRVAQFWREEGDLDKHRRYLEAIAADPHMLTLIGCFNGVPFSYFEIYWAKENRLGPFYDADDYDRGWHVLIGEDAYLGRKWISAWLPSLMHYLFLDDCRTQRIVGEPAADHSQQIRNLQASGFACIKHFEFPHKRALLVMLLRERFFGDKLIAPLPDGASGTAHSA